jgi:hypothetical protein
MQINRIPNEADAKELCQVAKFTNAKSNAELHRTPLNA